MRGKGYGWIEFVDEGGWEHSRKLYKKERKEIMMNYIRRRSGRRFKVSKLSELLGVSERTIQKELKELETEGVIVRKASYNESNRQTANVIIYVGTKKRLTGKELTIEKVYDPENKVGLVTDTD